MYWLSIIINRGNKIKIYNDVKSLLHEDNITYINIRRLETDELYEKKSNLGPKLYRQNQEDILYKKYMDQKPISSDHALFFCQSDAEKAKHIVNKLQSRYANLDKPITKLKAWDLNKDGRIEKDEMKGMLSKMNIHLNDNLLHEFFKIFQTNEMKANHGKQNDVDTETISYPIFLQTIMKHNFDIDTENKRDSKLLTPPQKKKKIYKIRDIDDESLQIFQRLRNKAERKFNSRQFTTATFRFLDKNYDSFINHQEFRDRLKYIDTSLTPKEAERIIKVLDVNNEGRIGLNQFAQCWNYSTLDTAHRDHQSMRPNPIRPKFNIFDSIDPNSTYYASNKERFNRSPFIPKSKYTQVSPSKQFKKNASNTDYNILHHT